MTATIETKTVRTILGRMERGEDLYETLGSVTREHGLRLGWVDGLGAVEKATLAYYDQEKKTYNSFEIERRLEITNLTGNVSLKDGQPMVHAHVTLADEEGRAFGGHLLPGTTVFACEFRVEELAGPDLVRGFDAATGLPLWVPPAQS
jgi:predicted DNA-binding protein with PD1-like motif